MDPGKPVFTKITCRLKWERLQTRCFFALVPGRLHFVQSNKVQNMCECECVCEYVLVKRVSWLMMMLYGVGDLKYKTEQN